MTDKELTDFAELTDRIRESERRISRLEKSRDRIAKVLDLHSTAISILGTLGLEDDEQTTDTH